MMFRQRLRGGHRLNNQTKPNIAQETAWQNQGDWNSIPSKESSPGTWDGGSDSAWNWDVNSNEANFPQPPVSSYKSNSLSPSSEIRGNPAAPESTNTLNPPTTYPTYDSSSNLVQSSTTNYAHPIQQQHCYTNPPLEPQIQPSYYNVNTQSSQIPQNQYNFNVTQHPQSHVNFLNSYQSVDQPPCNSSLNKGNSQANQNSENWTDWESWDDWNGGQSGSVSEHHMPTFTTSNQGQTVSNDASFPIKVSSEGSSFAAADTTSPYLVSSHQTLTFNNHSSTEGHLSHGSAETNVTFIHQELSNVSMSATLESDSLANSDQINVQSPIDSFNEFSVSCDESSVKTSNNKSSGLIIENPQTQSISGDSNSVPFPEQLCPVSNVDQDIPESLIKVQSEKSPEIEISEHKIGDDLTLVGDCQSLNPTISQHNDLYDLEMSSSRVPKETFQESEWDWDKDDWGTDNGLNNNNKPLPDEKISTSDLTLQDEFLTLFAQKNQIEEPPNLFLKEEIDIVEAVSATEPAEDMKPSPRNSEGKKDDLLSFSVNPPIEVPLDQFLSGHTPTTSVNDSSSIVDKEEREICHTLPDAACNIPSGSAKMEVSLPDITHRDQTDSGRIVSSLSSDFAELTLKEATPKNFSLEKDSNISDEALISQNEPTPQINYSSYDTQFDITEKSYSPEDSLSQNYNSRFNSEIHTVPDHSDELKPTLTPLSHDSSENSEISTAIKADSPIGKSFADDFEQNEPRSNRSSSSKIIPEIKARQESPFQPFKRNPNKPDDMTELAKEVPKKQTESSLWSKSEIPELPVRLSIAAMDLEKTKGLPVSNESFPGRVVPVVIPDLSRAAMAISKETSIDSSAQLPPSAHSGYVKPEFPTPKVVSLASQTLTNSPGVLDLSKASYMEDKSDIPPMHPPFSRMIPGESTKGESGTQSVFQVPTSTPTMPTGRVVTGNADPQPALLSRIKHEPDEVRLPPDGPDTEPLSDPNPPVVPPIRSETIGSEEPVTKSFSMKDSRSEKGSSSRRERSSWDRDGAHGNDYYADKYRDNTKESRDYYRDESPHSKWSGYERDYDRHHRRYDSDEEDEMHYVEASRSRRTRAYRDEMERYGGSEKDRERCPRRERRKKYEKQRGYHYSQDDDDRYYYDRSQPTSRSSSYTNLDIDSSNNSHAGRHRDDYYERPHRSRDRDAHYRDSRHDRKHPRDPYFRGYPPYADHYRSRDMYDPSYYYYYQKYLEHPYYREYYRQYFERYGYATGDSILDDKTSTRSGRSSVNDDLKKSSLSSGDISGVASLTDEGLNELPQRSTPPLFDVLHSSMSFTPCGKLIRVLPHDPKEGEKPLVEVIPLQQILSQDKEYSLRIEKMKLYPGPLTKIDTHKDLVIQFCEKKAAEISQCPSFPDRDSAILLWHYLALLVKQNGKVCGADLASLLLQKMNSSEGESHRGVGEANQTEGSQTDTNCDSNSTPSSVQNMTMTVQNEDQLVRKFKDYVSIGRTKEAVDFAVQNGLWVYAIAVASKMDSITQTRVMSAIDNCIPSSDIIQTLMQHLSGKKPDVAKSYSSERWGDWKHHLAVMVSNPSPHPERDQASIIALGDTLASRGQTYAAHLCYLAGEAEWGSFSKKDSRLVLLGSSHQQHLKAFATEDAIHCTEIYEYAKSLDSSSTLMSTFQSYKLIYAIRLAECGFPAKALKYCEVISSTVAKNPYGFHVEFVSKVFDLATQLKYHDVHYQMCKGELNEMTDPVWLRTLHEALYALQCWTSQQLQQAQSQLPEGNDVTQQIPPLSEPVIQHQDQPQMNLPTSVSPEYPSFHAMTPEIEAHTQFPAQSAEIPAVLSEEPVPTIASVPNAEDHQPLHHEELPPVMYAAAAQNDMTKPQYTESAPMLPPMSNDTSGFDMHSTSLPYMGSSSMGGQELSFPGQQHEILQTPFQSLPPVTNIPSSSMPNEMNYGHMTHQQSQQMDPKSTAEPSQDNGAASKEKDLKDEVDSKDKRQPGFLSRIFGWRESNQAKLPDDKNPSIVWDDDKKRWVNKDGDDEEEFAPPPPPMVAGMPSQPSSFRGPKKSRYVDPVPGKVKAKGPMAPMMPVHPGMAPPAPNNQGGGDPGMMGGVPHTDSDPSQWPNQPHFDNSLDVPQGEEGGHVPLMGMPPNVQPMLYNPGQFQQQKQQPQQALDGPSSQAKRPFQSKRPNYNPNQR